MDGIGEKVRELFYLLSKEQKFFLGGPPYSSEVERIVQNFTRFERTKILPNRQRIALGECVFNKGGEVIGYQEVTILQDAKPTSYERENIGLRGRFSYIQGKKILVHPNYSRQRVATGLLLHGIEIGERFDKKFIVDVNSANVQIISFLKKNNFCEIFKWKTPKMTEMYRFENAS